MDNIEKKIIEVKNVSIEFPGVKALQNVSCTFESGKAKALIGANGAGKSTLMKVLAGTNSTYTGKIYYNGKSVEIRTPRQARALGIGIVYQEVDSVLIPNLSVAENIMIDHLIYDVKGAGIIHWKKIHEAAEKILKELEISIKVTDLVSSLTLAQKQMVVIARTILQECSFLILDEPTAPLSLKETATLFSLIKRLKIKGCGIIFISHRLNELFEVCDDISVLRDGKNAGELEVSETAEVSEVVRMMLGNNYRTGVDKSGIKIGQTVLKADRVSDEMGRVHDINIEVKRGEIIGISGLVGAGKTELCKTLFGAYGRICGNLHIKGKNAVFHSPAEAIKAGIALIPEERRKEGIIVEESVIHNLSVVTLGRYSRIAGFINRKQEQDAAKKKIADLAIKTPSYQQKTGLLSGGNQQKVTIGKWLDSDADLYIFDEPTKGIDVGAKQEIYKLIIDLARQGKGVIYTSSEQSEIMLLSDRIYVMYDGTIQKELKTAQTNEEEILFYSTGGNR